MMKNSAYRTRYAALSLIVSFSSSSKVAHDFNADAKLDGLGANVPAPTPDDENESKKNPSTLQLSNDTCTILRSLHHNGQLANSLLFRDLQGCCDSACYETPMDTNKHSQ